ncbi:phosphotransferase family protein [Kitasatospora sp. NPDC006697]|uniref:phosphotransferase family protein n=1 Tax=Kitasatospora sp. NPDC006697 TaxID=3364020 RepID=UPI00367DF6D9
MAKAAFRVRADGEVLDRLDLRVDFLPGVGRPPLVKVCDVESLSKRRLDAAALDALLHCSLGQGGRLERELTGGTFNTAYRVRLFDGRSVLVKIAPPADVPVLRYERGILGTEAAVYRLLDSAAGARVPTPRLLCAGVDHLVLSWLDGSPWDQTQPHRPELLRRELGQLAALINAIPSPDGSFGYPAPESSLQADDWPAAFSLMTAALLTDAERFGAELGAPTKEFTALVAASQERLAEVAEPRLVHFDLWPGNVFHDGTRITGLIDHERAFFGDPAAELVSLEFGGAAGEDSEVVAGYREAGGELESTPGLAHRLALYRVYLGLILIIESEPRGFRTSNPEHYAWSREYLATQLDALRQHCAA